ncbi:MAG: bifunctional pyr operon transcriptional regulator/uracil phosphoribosyltransferase PyrR [Clostridia bacterium]|nr:bifunctional pyr operon transcriptional regulator/uracil phosphoribosyltransferase PyrR [Clostridia bacterium]
MDEKLIMDGVSIDRSIARLAHEIIERNADKNEVCLVGIQRRGVPLAHMIADNIAKYSDIKTHVGELDITLYRDDLSEISEQPELKGTYIDFPIKNKTVILVDDVFYTGRTARAAMDAIVTLGRPAYIQLAVLIDRGHREFPIRGDYVGKNLPTSKNEFVLVRLPEYDGKKEVVLRKREETE